MWKKIQQVLLRKSSDVIGIDIGTGSLKIVEIAWKKGQPVLKNFGIKELPDSIIEDGRILDSQQLSAIIRQLLATMQINSKNAVVAVGGRVMFARELLFPSMTTEEVREAIKWDLEKYVPYAPNSYYYDFEIVGQGNTESEIKVLLVASPLENINTMIGIVKDVGLKLLAVDAEPLALHRVFTDVDQAMIIDIGAQISQVTVFQNGSPAVIRNIPIGGRNFTNVIMQTLQIDFQEAEKIKKSQLLLSGSDSSPQYREVQQQIEILAAEFARDIRRTAEYYQQQNRNAMIDKIVITGGGAKLDNLSQYLSAQLGISSVPHDPLAKLKIPSSFAKEHLEQFALQLGTAIGLALRGGDI